MIPMNPPPPRLLQRPQLSGFGNFFRPLNYCNPLIIGHQRVVTTFVSLSMRID